MKKLLLIFLLVIYTAAAIGVGVKGFYCCNKLTQVSVTLQETSKQNTKTTKHCCNTKWQFFKVKDKHVASDASILLPNLWVAETAVIPTGYYINTRIGSVVAVANQTHAPPLLAAIPIYIFDCVYRI